MMKNAMKQSASPMPRFTSMLSTDGDRQDLERKGERLHVRGVGEHQAGEPRPGSVRYRKKLSPTNSANANSAGVSAAPG